jgi:hypothetical protein
MHDIPQALKGQEFDDRRLTDERCTERVQSVTWRTGKFHGWGQKRNAQRLPISE